MLPGALIMTVAVILAGSSKWASPTSGAEAPRSASAPRHLNYINRRWFKEFKVARRPYFEDWISNLDLSSLPGQLENETG